MELGKIRPTATIVAQFASGVDVTAICHEGKIFLPVIGGDFIKSETTAPTKTTEPVKESSEKVEQKKDSKKESKVYTEDELMEMATKDLLKMCKAMGIDPDDTEGKNTNKKLRTLILEAQEGEDEDEDEDEEESDESEDSDFSSQVEEILTAFDSGKKNKKKTIEAIMALSDEADKDDVISLIDKFEDDADMEISDAAEQIANVLVGKKPTSKKSSRKGKKENLVEPSDLKVGDRVSVWWDDDNQDWFDGEVKSISKKGKIVIAYDDDTEDAIDPEINTKIKLIK